MPFTQFAIRTRLMAAADEVLQVGFGEPDIATAPQAAVADGLPVRRLDAGPVSMANEVSTTWAK
jgi:hypothetical protein